MQVSRGKYCGLKLDTLASNETRPTLSKVKEAIFSMLFNDVDEAQVLDLFAGAGSLGIEALSCGANWVDFYDNNHDAIKVIEKNVVKLKMTKYQIKQLDYQIALNELINKQKQYDLIFLDPPYHLKIMNELLADISENTLLSTRGIVVCEVGLDEEVSEEYVGLEKYKDKKYGKTKIIMFRRRYQ